MKSILGLINIDAGDIWVCGEKVTYGGTRTNRYIGYLPDVPEFYYYLTAGEYLDLCGRICGMNKKEVTAAADEMLTLVGLSNEKSRIKGFSRGMKQRLGVAQALLNRPKLLICDEPTSALDPVGRKDILDVLLRAKEKTTVLFSTHILADVERVCTDIAFLDEGIIRIEGKVEDIRKKYIKNEFEAEFFDEATKEQVRKEFEAICREEDEKLFFLGDEEIQFRVMKYLVEMKANVRKIERCETSLESLFIETVKK